MPDAKWRKQLNRAAHRINELSRFDQPTECDVSLTDLSLYELWPSGARANDEVNLQCLVSTNHGQYPDVAYEYTPVICTENSLWIYLYSVFI